MEVGNKVEMNFGIFSTADLFSAGNGFLCSTLLFSGNGKELLLHPVCLRDLAGKHLFMD